MSISAGKIVAIHQPNFFPWLGYFDKINRADIFVFMDDVAYPKSGNSMSYWTNRVKIVVQGQEKWINCSIIREKGIQLIKNVKINNSLNWRNKVLKTIRYNYAKALFFDETISWVEPLINNPEENLSDYNINTILKICKLLSINTSFIKQSELNTSCSSTDLLVEITKKVGGKGYLCGGGTSNYQDDQLFDISEIELIYQQFKHPVYEQTSTDRFIEGLSIIDCFMNIGIKGVRELLSKENV